MSVYKHMCHTPFRTGPDSLNWMKKYCFIVGKCYLEIVISMQSPKTKDRNVHKKSKEQNETLT